MDLKVAISTVVCVKFKENLYCVHLSGEKRVTTKQDQTRSKLQIYSGHRGLQWIGNEECGVTEEHKEQEPRSSSLTLSFPFKSQINNSQF